MTLFRMSSKVCHNLHRLTHTQTMARRRIRPIFSLLFSISCVYSCFSLTKDQLRNLLATSNTIVTAPGEETGILPLSNEPSPLKERYLPNYTINHNKTLKGALPDLSRGGIVLFLHIPKVRRGNEVER